MKKALTYTAMLVGAYLIVANATGFGKAVSAAAGGYSTAVKTLQGR
jgi:hypothetical protein